MGSARIKSVRQRLAYIPPEEHTTSDKFDPSGISADPDYAVTKHERDLPYKKRIKDKRRLPKKTLGTGLKYKRVKGNVEGGETYKDVMKGIPGSRVVGTMTHNISEGTGNPMGPSEVAFKIHNPASIKGYSKSHKKKELDKLLQMPLLPDEKLLSVGHKTDPFKDPKKAHPALIQEGGDLEGGLFEPESRSTIVDQTLNQINKLADEGPEGIEEAKKLALQHIPNTRNMTDEQLEDMLEHIVDTDITSWDTSEGIMSISRKNADRYSKLHSARIQMARERLGAVSPQGFGGEAIPLGIQKEPDYKEWESLAEKYATPITHKQHRTISWLSPNGKFYDAEEFGDSEHRGWVQSLLKNSGNDKLLGNYEDLITEKDEYNLEDAQWQEDSGFARVNTSGGGELDVGFGDEPTKAQSMAVQDLAISRGYTSENIVVDGIELGEQKQLRRRMGLHKLGKLRQRIAEIGRPKQFNFKETLNKHWKLAAKDPRFKAFTHSSSFVGNVKYDQDEQSMQIILNGKTYDFCNVEERLFDSFSGAGSKGAFFNREIKSLHNCGAW